MDREKRNQIVETKDKWLADGNVGRAAACDFLLMKDMGIDIVYDDEKELVKEFKYLLQKQLETDNQRLILMVSTEIEKYLMDEKEELYDYLAMRP